MEVAYLHNLKFTQQTNKQSCEQKMSLFGILVHVNLLTVCVLLQKNQKQLGCKLMLENRTMALPTPRRTQPAPL